MIKADPMVGHNSIDDDAAVALIKRIESVQDRIDDENANKSEIFKEVKAKGYDADAFRMVLKERANARNGKAAKVENTSAFAELIRAALARKGV